MADEKTTPDEKNPAEKGKKAPANSATPTATEGKDGVAPSEAIDAPSGKGDQLKAMIFKNKMVVMIVAGLVLLSVIGGVLYFMFKPAASKEEVVEEIAAPIFFDLPEINSSIPKGKGKNGFLMVSFTLQLEKEEDREKIQKLQPNIMDAIQVYISSLRLDSLSTDASMGLISPIGLEKIRTNLILRINAVIAPAKIKTLLYKKFVAQ